MIGNSYSHTDIKIGYFAAPRVCAKACLTSPTNLTAYTDREEGCVTFKQNLCSHCSAKIKKGQKCTRHYSCREGHLANV